MEGRIRYLTDMTSLTTINLNIREEVNYIPPQAITFGSRIKTQWEASIAQTKEVFQWFILVVVRNAIGFGVFVLTLIIVLPLLRYVLPVILRVCRRFVDNLASANQS